jgi:hypothetical protein
VVVVVLGVSVGHRLRLRLKLVHDLIRKPVSTFRDHVH